MANKESDLPEEFVAARHEYLKSQNDPVIKDIATAPSDNDTAGISGAVPLSEGGQRALLVPAVEAGEDLTLPTRGKRMIPVRCPVGYTPVEFRNAVASAYHQYILDGNVTAEKIAEQTGITLARVQTLYGTIEFKRACEIRGLELTGRTGLTPEQDLALQVILDPYDGLTMSRKLKKAGISNTKYQAWMKQPLFRAQIQRVSEQLLDNNATALVQLERAVGEGDLRAIQYKLEVNNRHNPRRQQMIDVVAIMQGMMEILARHVQDPEVLQAVANDMRALAEGQNPTKQIEG